jgi:hypothetical protein
MDHHHGFRQRDSTGSIRELDYTGCLELMLTNNVQIGTNWGTSSKQDQVRWEESDCNNQIENRDDVPLVDDEYLWLELFKDSPEALRKIRPINQSLLGNDGVKWWMNQSHTFEFPALEGAWRHCGMAKAQMPAEKIAKQAVLYLHSKGSTKAEWFGEAFRWRQVMNHFVIHRYQSCLQQLQCGYSTCGANLQKAAFHLATWLHYSGNFWWARCDYIVQLPSPRPAAIELTPRRNCENCHNSNPPTGRFIAEWWLLSSAEQQQSLRSTSGASPLQTNSDGGGNNNAVTTGGGGGGNVFKNCWGTPGVHVSGDRSHGSDTWDCITTYFGGLPDQCNPEPFETPMCATGWEGGGIQVGCRDSSTIVGVDFVDFGLPEGSCAGSFTHSPHCNTIRGFAVGHTEFRNQTNAVKSSTDFLHLAVDICVGHKFCRVQCDLRTDNPDGLPAYALGCNFLAWDKVRPGSEVPRDSRRALLQITDPCPLTRKRTVIKVTCGDS